MWPMYVVMTAAFVWAYEHELKRMCCRRRTAYTGVPV